MAEKVQISISLAATLSKHKEAAGMLLQATTGQLENLTGSLTEHLVEQGMFSISQAQMHCIDNKHLHGSAGTSLAQKAALAKAPKL